MRDLRDSPALGDSQLALVGVLEKARMDEDGVTGRIEEPEMAWRVFLRPVEYERIDGLLHDWEVFAATYNMLWK